MVLLLAVVTIVLLLTILKYIRPFLIRHSLLHNDYRDISLLPLSPIPFVGNIHQFDKRSHVFYDLIRRLSTECQSQGKGAFCLWSTVKPIVFMCSAEGLKTFINSTKQLSKSMDYTFLEPWLKTGLLTSKNEKWRSHRRFITPSFHDTELLNSYMRIFNEQSCVLAHRFDGYSRQLNETHDLYPHISACALDIIAEAATGINPRAQSGGETDDFVAATVRFTEILSLRLRSPWMWFPFIFDRLSIGCEQKEVLKVLHGFSRKIIKERLDTFNTQQVTNIDDKTSKRRLAFLDSLLTQMQAEKLSLDDIQEEVDTFMFAGHDTTAAALNFFCYLMGCYPDVQAKVHAEMDVIFGDDRKRPCTMEDIQQMTYLDCVIKESLRILPPVPIIGREVQEDFIYCGHTIRKGTTVNVFIHGIHFDANVFPDPEKFDPERFAESSFISGESSPFAFIPFSAGPRNCIGQRFAGLEERVVLSTLFRRFSFHSTQTMEDIHLSINGILRTEVPIQMIIKQR
ncbi:hypothetical protein I4U23_010789 [Adineta vaga]|nr:hypothetical protein I4U23_010789 [Adineta vaga]